MPPQAHLRTRGPACGWIWYRAERADLVGLPLFARRSAGHKFTAATLRRCGMGNCDCVPDFETRGCRVCLFRGLSRGGNGIAHARPVVAVAVLSSHLLLCRAWRDRYRLFRAGVRPNCAAAPKRRLESLRPAARLRGADCSVRCRLRDKLCVLVPKASQRVFIGCSRTVATVPRHGRRCRACTVLVAVASGPPPGTHTTTRSTVAPSTSRRTLPSVFTRPSGYTFRFSTFSRYALLIVQLFLAVVAVRSSSSVNQPSQLFRSRIFTIPGKSTPPFPNSQNTRFSAVVLYVPGFSGGPLYPPRSRGAQSFTWNSMIRDTYFRVNSTGSIPAIVMCPVSRTKCTYFGLVCPRTASISSRVWKLLSRCAWMPNFIPSAFIRSPISSKVRLISASIWALAAPVTCWRRPQLIFR